MTQPFDASIRFIREIYNEPEAFIPLHEPRFRGNEKKYLNDCIDSTFVSSVGQYVDRFEEMTKEYTGCSKAIAIANGTSALHLALVIAGVKRDELVITQPLSFIATCNAISYIGAEPLFVDIDSKTLGLSDEKLEEFFSKHTHISNDGACIHTGSGKRIAACVPMHTFGHPARIDRIASICASYQVPLVEDSAESIGSRYQEKYTGRFGQLGIFSFNGNKTITCGGGGMIITDDEQLGIRAKHLSTQSKVPHRWNFEHDNIGYNYRLPNLNAALACAQMENLEEFIADKREIASLYAAHFRDSGIEFVAEPEGSRSNYWLNAILLKDRTERDRFLQETNDKGIMTRPAWHLMPDLPMFRKCIVHSQDNARNIESRLVNIPSSVRKRK